MDSDTSRGQLLLRTEGAFNEALPANANGFRALRFTKESLAHTNDVVVSNDIRNDRMKSDQYLVGVSVAGAFSFELSGGSFQDIIEASLGGTFGAGTTNAGVTTATLDPTVQLYRSFGLERGLLDIALFRYFQGVMINTLALTVPSKNIVTADATIMGVTVATPTGVTGANPAAAAANVNPAWTSGPGINNILVNGLPIGVGVKEIKLSIANNLRARETVDSLLSRPFGRGDLEITGSIQVYMSNPALYNYFLGNTALSLQFTIGDGLHNSMTFLLPRIKPTTDDGGQIGGSNADVMETFAFRALFDSVTGRQIIVTKASF